MMGAVRVCNQALVVSVIFSLFDKANSVFKTDHHPPVNEYIIDMREHSYNTTINIT